MGVLICYEQVRKTGGQGLSAKIPGGVAGGYIEDILVRKRSHTGLAALRSRIGTHIDYLKTASFIKSFLRSSSPSWVNSNF
jgi:hypothetical protein